MQSDVRVRLFSLIFFLSGATSLIYQVAWTRKLSLYFGSDVYSAAVTLSAFMGGLGLGSWLSGRLARRLTRPLLGYGILELLVALYAVGFAAMLTVFDPLLTAIYRDTYVESPAFYQFARAAIAFVVLLPPTALMGATLPLIIQHFATSRRVLGVCVGHFYAINTFGALAGAAFGGFVLLPRFGITHSIATAAVVNLAIAVGALLLALAYGPVSTEPLLELPSVSAPRTKSINRTRVPLALGISGFAVLALEVVWMRILVLSFSATVYAFSIMVSCFLLGIFVGSEREARRVDAVEHPARRLLFLELALFTYVAFLAILTYFAPGLFGILLWGLTAATNGNFAAASVSAQAITAALLIIAPTVWSGAAFPLAVKVFSRDIGERATDTGKIYAANTLGALLGALVAGFALIPLFGAHASLIVIAGFFLSASFVLAPLAKKSLDQRSKAMRSLGLIAGFAFALIAVLLPTQVIANFNMQRSMHPQVIYHGEGVAHTVDIVRTAGGNTLMMVDGNIEADTTLVQRRHFILKAHLPLLLHQDPKDIAVIGLGLGVTLAATAHNPAVEHIKVIELSPEMVRAQAYLRDLTQDVLASPKTDLLIDDGRNFLNRSLETFDVITADPIHPRITGVGYLYTSEYYEAVKSRLRPGGYILQWMPMYAISRRSFDAALRTFAHVFPNGSFWYVRGHGLLVAGLTPLTINFTSLKARTEYPTVHADLVSIDIHSAADLLGLLLMDAQHIARYLQSTATTAINSDDNGYLEYNTPYELLNPTLTIVQALMPFAGWDQSRLINATPSDIAAINRASAVRLGMLLEELNEPIE